MDLVLRAAFLGDVLKAVKSIAFDSPDITPSGWLGSKHHWINIAFCPACSFYQYDFNDRGSYSIAQSAENMSLGP